MFRTSLIAIAALTATTALADGPQPVITPPVIAPASDWSGFYGGLSVGKGEAKNATASVDTTSRGLFLGYNYDMGQYVLGGELAYDVWDSNASGSNDVSNVRLLGRVGYDAGRVLPYLTAGFANISESGFSETGFAYGAGVDFMATDNVIVGLQYLEQRYEDIDNSNVDLDLSSVSLRVSYKF